MTAGVIRAAVVAHPDRLGRALELAGELRDFDAMTITDLEEQGCTANHLFTWRALSRLPSDWSMVLEDDAILHDDFAAQARLALEATPAPVVSFYLGQGRPPHWQTKAARASATGNPFIVCTTLLHCVAVAVRTDYLIGASGMVLGATRAAREGRKPIDEAITEWAKHRCVPVAYTNPSLVNHDHRLPSVAQHQYVGADPAPRVAHRFGGRPHWLGGFSIM